MLWFASTSVPPFHLKVVIQDVTFERKRDLHINL